MRFATAVAAFVVVVAGASPALADHPDPTHGVLPHSIGDSPTNIHAVSISTPHPYPHNEVLTYEIQVDGVDSLAVHLERYDVDGFYSSFSQACFGSFLTILDGATGLELETICGNYFVRADEFVDGNDFWTPDYLTNHLVLELSTGQPFGDPYGFDIYEVASNGARPVVSVPYSSRATVYVEPHVRYELDPFAPESSTASLFAGVGAEYGDTGGRLDGGADYGRFFACGGFICTEREGVRVRSGTQASGAGHGFVFDGQLVLAKDEGAPGGYGPPEPTARCEVDGDTCL